MCRRYSCSLFGPQINVEHASCFETVPAIPVYRPSEAEFRDFATCMSFIERCGAQHIGLCKIIPPRSWQPRRNGYDDVDCTIDKPIVQLCAGSEGIFLQDVRAQKSMSFKKFEKLSNSAKLQTPRHESFDELEEIYWSSIENLQPLYGANVAGSLTDPEEVTCNIPKLQSTLSDVLSQEDIEIGGVNTPYLYFGAWATTFAWHVEDMDLYSINYLHFGAPKLWYCIPPAFARKFEAFAREHFKPEFLACHSFLRHKSILIHPKILAAAGIPTRRILQKEGEIMCTFPYGYHAGFNTGVNCAESTNFALPRWVEYGKKANICRCWDDTVRIDMAPFVRRIQPHLYEDWQRGMDAIAHPLDVYKPGWKTSPPACSYDSIIETTAADLNVRGLYYTQSTLDKATLPRFLGRNKSLRHLWSGFALEFNAIIHFNRLIGLQDPFCCICAFFWPPMVVGKAISGLQKDEQVPPSSEPYLSEVVFCRSPLDFPTIRAAQDSRSRVLICSQCHVVVHARCYGYEENDIDGGYFSGPSGWRCDACTVGVLDPRCVLCPLRGGAFKALVNTPTPTNGRLNSASSCSSSSSPSFWVHLACAIAVGPSACHFVDVVRRQPLLLRGSSGNGDGICDYFSADVRVDRKTRGRPRKVIANATQLTAATASVSMSANDWHVADEDEILTDQTQLLKRRIVQPLHNPDEMSPSPTSVDHDFLPTQKKRRDGRPAQLARSRGLGKPRLTISGRLGSPRWWSSTMTSPTASNFLDQDEAIDAFPPNPLYGPQKHEVASSSDARNKIKPNMSQDIEVQWRVHRHVKAEAAAEVDHDSGQRPLKCEQPDITPGCPRLHVGVCNDTLTSEEPIRPSEVGGGCFIKQSEEYYATAEIEAESAKNDSGDVLVGPKSSITDYLGVRVGKFTETGEYRHATGEYYAEVESSSGDPDSGLEVRGTAVGKTTNIVQCFTAPKTEMRRVKCVATGAQVDAILQTNAEKKYYIPSPELQIGREEIYSDMCEDAAATKDDVKAVRESIPIEISDDEDHLKIPITGRPRSRRRSRLPTWTTAGDFIVTRPRKMSQRRSITASEVPSETAVGTERSVIGHSNSILRIATPKTPRIIGQRDHCEECGLPSPGGPHLDLALVRCWHENCPGRVHLTCAQLGGYLIATGRYPYCFYIACKRHNSEYKQYDQVGEEVPLKPGDAVYALYPGNGRYYKAVAVELAVPRRCKVVFHDGTFSRDTPPDCIVEDDESRGSSSIGHLKVGSNVRVRWRDGEVYSAVFQGSSFDKWIVRFKNGKEIRLRSDKIFRCNERIPTHIRRLIMR